MRYWLKFVFGALLVANGLVMLAVPATWYGAVPGVPATGPLNHHFVRDIGAAYFAAGAGLVWFAAKPAARPAAAIAAVFLGVHALIHFTDLLFGREPWSSVPLDLPLIYLPPAFAAWLVWGRRKQGAAT
jgi:uncharacterized protein YjeT (DUF2065 family)